MLAAGLNQPPTKRRLAAMCLLSGGRSVWECEASFSVPFQFVVLWSSPTTAAAGVGGCSEELRLLPRMNGSVGDAIPAARRSLWLCGFDFADIVDESSTVTVPRSLLISRHSSSWQKTEEERQSNRTTTYYSLAIRAKNPSPPLPDSRSISAQTQMVKLNFSSTGRTSERDASLRRKEKT